MSLAGTDVTGGVQRPAGPPGQQAPSEPVPRRPAGARSIEDTLAAARDRLVRLTPAEAFGAVSGGAVPGGAAPGRAVLVDIRPASQRAADGEIPGSWIIERNHLEWRLDPASSARLPWVTGYDHQIIVFCHQGYTSSLAAAALLDLGMSRSTDLIGGFAAWAAAGLPTAPAAAHAAAVAMGAVHADLLCARGGLEVGAEAN